MHSAGAPGCSGCSASRCESGSPLPAARTGHRRPARARAAASRSRVETAVQNREARSFIGGWLERIGRGELYVDSTTTPNSSC
jgi:hypothetical protein